MTVDHVETIKSALGWLGDKARYLGTAGDDLGTLAGRLVGYQSGLGVLVAM